jgi:CRP-like cAMP-binding protein
MPPTPDLHVATELRTIRALAKIPVEALEELAPLVCQRRVLAQVPVVAQGVPSSSWLLLVRGAAKTTRLAQTEADGSVIVLDVMRAPCVVSDPSIFDGIAAPASVVTLRASHVFAVDRRALLGVLANHPTLSQALLARLAEEVRSLVHRVDEIVSGPVDERVKTLLESLAQKHGTPLGDGHFIAIPLRRRDIASMVNATTETVSRLLAKFERDGLAKSTRDGIWWKAAAKTPRWPAALEVEPPIALRAEALPQDRSGQRA